MSRIALPALVLVLLGILGGCATRTDNGQVWLGDQPIPEAAQPDGEPLEFPARLAEYMKLPDEVRGDLHERAWEELRRTRDFQSESHQWRDSYFRHWYYTGYYIDTSTMGIGLGLAIKELKSATGLDPAFAEGWALLGRFCAVAGDNLRAKQYLDNARLAALARAEAGQPVEDDILLEMYRDRAWAYRDLALWKEGLDAVREGLVFRNGDRELVLIKGLCLAGDGQYAAAHSLAVRMEPWSFPRFDLYHYGTSRQTSDFANRWIKSQALIATGDYDLAYHVFGEMRSYPWRRLFPLQSRFWADVGLAAELAGEEQAPLFYAIGLVGKEYHGFYPWSAGNLQPLVLDVPHETMPYFTSFGGRFQVGGSPLAYAASQMNRMALSIFEGQRNQAAGRALLALEIAEKRNIHPDVCQALRGRIYFASDELVLAREQLQSAYDSFTAREEIDTGTSLLLGLLEMDEEDFGAAVGLLEEAVEMDPYSAVGWRSLGVSYVRLNRRQDASYAMTRALELDPGSVAGLYNRGLLHLQDKDFVAAVRDLDRAFRIDPENHEVQRLLQMAASGHRANGGDPADLKMISDAGALDQEAPFAEDTDTMLAELEAEIEGFFAVPDSVRAQIGPEDDVVVRLEEEYAAAGDLQVRKMLALAYMDRRMFSHVQFLLSPGWGEDLTPEEEIMLLYVDRSLGQEDRAEELAEAVLRGEAGTDNIYVLFDVIRRHRQHWRETTLRVNHYPEDFSAKFTRTSNMAWGAYFRNNYHNVRAETYYFDGSPTGVVTLPRWFTDVDKTYGGTAAQTPVGGGRVVGGRKAGNVTK